MRGEVIVMEPTDYEAWLRGGIRGGTMADASTKLYDQLGCITCHGTGHPWRVFTASRLN
jgi:cytochrome c oxidase subunit 2